MKANKQRILILIPVAIIAILIAYSWAIILFTDVYANWRHHVALILFIPVLFFFFKNDKITVFTAIAYLLIGTANMLSLTPTVRTNSFGVGIGSLKIETPSFQLVSFGVLVVLLILNFDTLTNFYLDYKDAKKHSRK
jgi:hypothetical protein